MVDFLTIEDVNSIVAEYYTIPFWDTIIIDTGEDLSDFTDRHYSYLTVSRQKLQNNTYQFVIVLNNDLCRNYCYFIDGNNDFVRYNKIAESPQFTFTILCNTPDIKCMFYLNDNEPPLSTNYHEFRSYKITDYTKTYVLDEPFDFFVEFEALNPNLDLEGEEVSITFFKKNGQSELYYETIENNRINMENITLTSDFKKQITIDYNFESFSIYLKQFKKINIVDIPNDLILDVGVHNTFNLISESSNLTVDCNYPVTVEGKSVTIDLTDKEDLYPFEILVTTVDDDIFYYNEWIFRLKTDYPLINNETDLINLFSNGGVGKLNADITLTDDLNLNKNVYLLGENFNITGLDYDKSLNINENLVFKADNLVFNNISGLIQFKGSKVELNKCTFNECYGKIINGFKGGVIYCKVNKDSLNDTDDFITSLNECTINNCDIGIIHGGNLTVTDCEINIDMDTMIGGLGGGEHLNFPYFIYQTDGNATLTGNQFNCYSTSDKIEYDVYFGLCVFIIGETAIINGLNYDDWQNNNITSFVETAKNTSKIHLTYYYDLIEDYIRLETDNGYCHGVSGVDYIFKTNVKPEKVN